VDSEAEVDAITNLRRLRAVVQNLNIGFTNDGLRRGRKLAIDGGISRERLRTSADRSNECLLADTRTIVDEGVRAVEAVRSSEDEDHTYAAPSPQPIARPEAIEWVLRISQRSRGRELAISIQC